MIEELHDALSCALNNRRPLESTKYEAEFSYDCLKRIARFVSAHEGEMALFYLKDGKREVVPKLVQIVQIIPCGALVRYKCYDPEGKFRCYLTATCAWTSLYCGDAQLKIFGNI